MLTPDQLHDFELKIKNRSLITNSCNKDSELFPLQESASIRIIAHFFYDTFRWLVLNAQMQSGKSGTFSNLPFLIRNNDFINEKLGIAKNGENCFLITGINQCDIFNQLKDDFCDHSGMKILRKNVLKLSDLKRLSQSYNSLKNSDQTLIDNIQQNSLIIIDESHLVSTDKQTIKKFLQKVLKIEASFKEKDLAIAKVKNLRFVSVSATPMAELKSMEQHNILKYSVGLYVDNEKYFGIQKIFKNNRIHQSFLLKENHDYIKLIDIIKQKKQIGYVIIRDNGGNYESLKEYLCKHFKVLEFNQRTKININDILIEKPKNIVIILIKDKLRAAVRVETENVFLVFDNPNSQSDTTVQSLLGRCCGYLKNENIDIFCNVEMAQEYLNWVNDDYNSEYISVNNRGLSKKIEQRKYIVIPDGAIQRVQLKKEDFIIAKQTTKRFFNWKNELLKKYFFSNPKNATKYGNNYFIGSFYKITEKTKFSTKLTYDRKSGFMIYGDKEYEINKKIENHLGKYLIVPCIPPDDHQCIEFSVGRVIFNDKYLDFNQNKITVSNKSIFYAEMPNAKLKIVK